MRGWSWVGGCGVRVNAVRWGLPRFGAQLCCGDGGNFLACLLLGWPVEPPPQRRRMFRRACRASCYACCAAQDGQEARDKLMGYKPAPLADAVKQLESM